MTRSRRQWLARARGAQTCPIRICRGPLLDETDGTGRVALRCPRCERRLAGICRDCPAPVEGQRGKAVRCGRCKVVARQRAARQSELRDREGRRRRERARYRANADLREKKASSRRAWRARHAEQVARHKRREALRQLPSRLAYYREYNAKRRDQKRAHARAQYYRLYPERPQPICRTCQVSIPWAPPGRPPVRCDDCVPPSVLRRRQPRRVTTARVAAVAPSPRQTHPCLGGCGQLLIGTRKKCDACKAAFRRDALARCA